MDERAKMVDFLVEKISEENKDAGKYMEAGSWTDSKEIKATLTAIANEELTHQAKLVGLLATMAREVPEHV